MPKFESIEEMVEFFDTHDMAEHFDEMPEAHFDVDIQRRNHLVLLKPNDGAQSTLAG